MFNYVFAPFKSEIYCHINFIVTTCVTYQIILLFDAIIIVKYVFIFHIKNPTVLQDDFWTIFVNFWIFMFNLIVQIVYAMWPGRNTSSIIFCIGKISHEHAKEEQKRIYVFMLIAHFSAFLHIGFWISSKLLKHYSANKYNEFRQFENKWANALTRENMFSLASQLITVFFLVMFLFYIPDFINISCLPVFDHYPNYLLIFIRDLVLSSLCGLLFVVLVVIRNEKLQKDVWNEISTIFNTFKRWQSSHFTNDKIKFAKNDPQINIE